ncbi:MAG: acetoin dehydrogenase dihydrolipoyllysine-residue acetyltransferase subunit, partial [Reyranella sp.]
GGRQRDDLRHVLADATVPRQVVWGRADRIIPPAHAEGLPVGVACHLLDQVGHLVHMERSGEVNRLIAELIAAAPSA